MNAQRKKSAIAKYKPVFDGGASEDELKSALAEDEKQYTPDEIAEIASAITGGDPSEENEEQEEAKTKKASGPKTKTLNVKYEEWRVEPVYDIIRDQMGKEMGKKLTGFEKLKKLRETSITPDKMELLNEQSENTLVHLYPA